ncbi:hypothetical protein GCM10020000_62130 [Streptomyces olivoverticillatus]
MKRLARYATAALIFLAPLAPMAPLAAATASSAEPDPVKSHSLAPLHKTSGHSIPGHYIVILRQGAAIPRSLASRLGVTPDIVYSHAIHGFAATLTPAQLEAVRKAPDVESVEEDAVFKASQDAPRAGGRRLSGRGRSRTPGAWTASTRRSCRWTGSSTSPVRVRA